MRFPQKSCLEGPNPKNNYIQRQALYLLQLGHMSTCSSHMESPFQVKQIIELAWGDRVSSRCWIQPRLHLGRLDPTVDFVVGAGRPRDFHVLVILYVLYTPSITAMNQSWYGDISQALAQHETTRCFPVPRESLQLVWCQFCTEVTRCQEFATAKPKRSMQQYVCKPRKMRVRPSWVSLDVEFWN